METESIRLTQYAHGGGCGCKIAPAFLEQILKNKRPSKKYPSLILGNEGNEDAAAWELPDEKLLLSTADFFMPIVDHPRDFGSIATANSLSDIYAKGGAPIIALAILGWPLEKLPAEIAAEVMEGASIVCEEAGIPIAGGHSIDNPEPIFGLSVNGIVEKKNLKRNSTAREGDLIFLTKPLGLGIITTAAKRGLADEKDIEETIEWMKKLNRVGYELGKLPFIHSMTDVTGFGLLGHLIEMAKASNLSADLHFRNIPVLKNIQHYIQAFIYPDMTMKNYNAFRDQCSDLDAGNLLLLCDPQTSGGLLISGDARQEKQIRSILEDAGWMSAPIGVFKAPSGKIVEIISQ